MIVGVRVKGFVKFFNVEKGWGFIVPDSADGDVFVHKADLETLPGRKLAPDQRVTFEINQTAKGNGRKASSIELA